MRRWCCAVGTTTSRGRKYPQQDEEINKNHGSHTPTKAQLLVLLKDSVVSLDEKCLHRGLNMLRPQRVPPSCHMAPALNEITVRGSGGHRGSVRGHSFSLRRNWFFWRYYQSRRSWQTFSKKYNGKKGKEIHSSHFLFILNMDEKNC